MATILHCRDGRDLPGNEVKLHSDLFLGSAGYPWYVLTPLSFRAPADRRQIVNEIYNKIYSGKLDNLKMQSVLDLEDNLRTFYHTLPDVLRLDDITTRSFCPPPHILCLKYAVCLPASCLSAHCLPASYAARC